MARKSYSDEFRRQAVDLYESTPGATLRGIAADLGIVRGTLSHWVDLHGTGKKTALDGTTRTSPMTSTSNAKVDPARPEAPAAKIARLQARVTELEATEKKLTTEREILRSAAKCFAGETNW